MSRQPRRRAISIPGHLFADLRAHCEREKVSVAGLVSALVWQHLERVKNGELAICGLDVADGYAAAKSVEWVRLGLNAPWILPPSEPDYTDRRDESRTLNSDAPVDDVVRHGGIREW